MRLVERVARKALHIRKDLFSHLFRHAARDRAVDIPALAAVAVDEFIALRHEFGFVLFAHRAADKVSLSERKSRKILEDLHDLLLIDNDAVGNFQDMLQQRRVVFDLLRIELVLI